ncbi:MAG TPA: glycosyltransferase family 4 protein, partial [Nitrososphaera sp.]|nr:glycosyltransferase family 4 protein [Nitrososphaera sp.]
MALELESEIHKIAPTIFFAHTYSGTCISGTKSFKSPIVTPCHRRFGWKCMLHYYPHRCGGWSPLTMVNLFRLQSKHLENLNRYTALITHSDSMKTEFINNGLNPERIYNLLYTTQHNAEVFGAGRDANLALYNERGPFSQDKMRSIESDSLSGDRTKPCWRLLFIGRMELLKGGHIFLDALPEVMSAVNRHVYVTFAGDGPKRREWKRKADLIADGQKLKIEFTGWVDKARLANLLKDCHLLVVPSLWPEPFGLVGPEAGTYGVPAAAFDVGGIPEWLKDGVNGFLAPGDPPTAAGLASAIIKCLSNPNTHAGLCHGAIEVARNFRMEIHVGNILNIFHKILAG